MVIGTQTGCELAVNEDIHIRCGYRFRLFVADCSEEYIEVAGIAFWCGALTIATIEVLVEAATSLIHVGLQ